MFFNDKDIFFKKGKLYLQTGYIYLLLFEV